MGDPRHVPDLDENIPHAKEAMSGSWPWFIHWDWPVNYLNALDNDCDVAHPNLMHATCAPFLDQLRWDEPFTQDLPCNGLQVGIKGVGPPIRGLRSVMAWDMHVPGYIYFTRKWGLPNNISYCNTGPNRAMVMSQGRLADRRLEKLARSDLTIIRFHKMMEQTYAAERKQAAEDGQPCSYTEPETVPKNTHAPVLTAY